MNEVNKHDSKVQYGCSPAKDGTSYHSLKIYSHENTKRKRLFHLNYLPGRINALPLDTEVLWHFFTKNIAR